LWQFLGDCSTHCKNCTSSEIENACPLGFDGFNCEEKISIEVKYSVIQTEILKEISNQYSLKVPSFGGKTDPISSFLIYKGIGDVSPLWNEIELVNLESRVL